MVGLPVPAFFFGGSLPKEEETAPFASHCGHGLAFAAGWRKVKGEEGMRPITWSGGGAGAGALAGVGASPGIA